MFQHIVLIGLPQALSDIEHRFVDQQCKALKQSIVGLADMRFIANESDRSPQFSHAVVSSFENAQAHDAYQRAPQHVALRNFMVQHKAQMVVLDFTS